MAYLFDTDAISELLRPRPQPIYLTRHFERIQNLKINTTLAQARQR